MKELNQKLAVIQTKLKAKKSSYNSFGKYHFRKSEDILEAIKPFLIEHGVTVTINEELIMTDPVPTMKSTATISDGENAIHATALVGVDLNQKGMQTAQQFGAASTYGKKYALGNLLLIDDTEDADSGQKPSGAIDKIKQAAKPAITKDQLTKAKEYVAAGGSIEAIESKYKMTNEQRKILQKLKIDEEYYGEFGNQFLSNSHVGKLLKDPLNAFEPSKPSPAFLVGGYFHTCILEPDKLEKFKVVKSTNRNTKAYKDVAGGELCLLQQEVDMIELMRDKVMNNDICRDLILGSDFERTVDYEVPMITELFGNKWKGKADIVNHDEKLIIDLKTTADIEKFQWSANKYNYDSQAYIYSKLFGYEFLFIVIDKNSHQIGMFDCSSKFYERGEEKVSKASEAYDLFYKTKDFDPKQYFISKTL